jgi:integrase
MTATQNPFWKARILIAKTSGLRRGEVLNLTVNDIDFAKSKIIVQPKPDSEHTWRWVVKDKERRELPLVEEVAKLLTAIQLELPEKQPYFFLPPERYQYLINLMAGGNLIDRIAKCPVANFRRGWKQICSKAAVEGITFHDLRATCITEWFEQGMMPHEVQRLAGHSSIETTMKYYVGIRESMIERARLASSAALGTDFGAHLAHTPHLGQSGQKKDYQSPSQVIGSQRLTVFGARGLEPPTS